MDRSSITTIYDTEYFESHEEAQEVLHRHALKGPVLALPEFEVIRDVAQKLTATVREQGRLSRRDVLLAYQQLRKSRLQTDTWCLLADEQDASLICGGKVELGIDAAGAYYYCQKEPDKHIFSYPLQGQSSAS